MTSIVKPHRIVSSAVLAVLLLVVGSVPSSLWGQEASLASIFGKVVDQKGAVMPGVQVKATSTSLQTEGVTTTTDDGGNYRLGNLPAPGVYRVSFEFLGFQTFVANNMNLSAGGFAAKLDVNMQLGQVVSTVEVTGESPVIDTTSAVGTSTLEQNELAVLPKGGGVLDMYQLAPGITSSGPPDVADSNMGYKTTIQTYGALLEPLIKWEGIEITAGDHSYTAGSYMSSYEIGEVTFQTVGQNADVNRAGFTMDTVVKSGSNAFHGSVLGDYENPAFQGNNITPTLKAQGFSTTNPLNLYSDVAADFGGRIKRDKLWFYGFYSRQEQSTGAIGFVSGPDAAGCWQCADAPVAYSTQVLPQGGAKVNYQMTRNMRWTFAYIRARKSINARSPNSTTPFPSTNQQLTLLDMGKAGFLWTPSPRWVINIVGGDNDGLATTLPQPGTDVPGNPSSLESSTKLNYGPSISLITTPNNRWVLNSSASYTHGTHNVKLGLDWVPWENRSRINNYLFKHGNYQLGFTNGKPNQITTYNYPFTGQNGYNSEGLYVMDSWTIRPRFTLNYGVRWDRLHDYYPEQQKPAGQFSAAATYPAQSVSLFKDFTPRVGFAWDIFGKGKTVVKASYGLFGDDLGSYFAQNYNPNSVGTNVYKWTGLDATGKPSTSVAAKCVQTGFNNDTYLPLPAGQPASCDVDPAFLATLEPGSPSYLANNPVLTSSTLANLNQVNPNLKEPFNSIYSARVEQQIIPNVAFSAGYVYTRSANLVDLAQGQVFETLFPNRPYSAYTVPFTFTDSGLGGTGNPVTVWSYPAAYSAGSCPSCNLFMYTNAKEVYTYSTLFFEITKRYSKRWNATASYWNTKNHTQTLSNPQSPNNIFGLDENRYWQAHGTVLYSGPWGVQASGIFQAENGNYGQRTSVFSNNSQLLQGNVTRNMEPFGSQQGPVISTTNLKVGKSFKLGENRKLEADWQMYNVFNSSAAITTSYQTGPTFGRALTVVNPRVYRISGKFEF